MNASSKFLVIDNYDSFTFNLVHYLGELGTKLDVIRNDEKTSEEIVGADYRGLILSPGPCTPNEAGICVDLIQKADGKLPIFGVCLGMQSIAQAYGGKVVRAPYMMHGKTSPVHHEQKDIFSGVPTPFTATRYHSLIAEKESLPDCLEVTAWTDDNIIMALAHQSDLIYGVQFHPESIASEYGHKLLKNFIDLCHKEKS